MKSLKLYFLLFIIFFFLFPFKVEAQEGKSKTIVIGTAIGIPVSVSLAGLFVEPPWVLMRFAPLSIATMHIISHWYLDDPSNGLKYLLIKSLGALLMFSTYDYYAWRGPENRPEDYLTISGFAIGGGILLGTYLLEICSLLKNTNDINNNMSTGKYNLHPILAKQSISIGFTLSF